VKSFFILSQAVTCYCQSNHSKVEASCLLLAQGHDKQTILTTIEIINYQRKFELIQHKLKPAKKAEYYFSNNHKFLSKVD